MVVLFNKKFIGILCLVTVVIPLYSQVSDNYNVRYSYPFSMAVEYQNISPLNDYSSLYETYEVVLDTRFPLPDYPVIQPLLRLGITTYDNQSLTEPEKWDHQHWYGQAGLAYSHRFDKKFEMGLEICGGYSLALFPDLIPEEGTIGTNNLLVDGGGRIIFSPSYNIALSIHPGVRYQRSLDLMDDFDGFSLGLGFSLAYRFGEDPDGLSSSIRAVRFDSKDIPDLFAAMQSYYVENPLGSVTITNSDRKDITEIEISFFQSGYMDSPTSVLSLPVLESGQTMEIPLKASFNSNIFTLEGVTPLNGEVIVSYLYKGRPVEQKTTVSYDLYDKTSMVWDDDRKVAAFITPADSALRNYASFIKQSCHDAVLPSYSEPLQRAIQTFHALGEIGCLYQADPTHPYTEVSGESIVIDSINLPRRTLKNITGDCDDLTVLYCSLLETVGIETGFITVPGHIYAAFNTKMPAKDYRLIHPDRSMTVVLKGEVWIPVEITMIGTADFLSAWRVGADSWNKHEAEGSNRAFYTTAESRELFRSVGLTQTDLGLQYGRGETIRKDFKHDLDDLTDLIIGEYETALGKSTRKQDFNHLGIIYSRLNQYDLAERAFKKSLELDPEYGSANINLANLEYFKGNYQIAYDMYSRVYDKVVESGYENSGIALKLLVNMSQVCHKLEQYDQAMAYYSLASNINPDGTTQYSSLTRADNITDITVLFAEED